MKLNNYIFFLRVSVLVLASQVSAHAQKANALVFPSVIGAAGGTHSRQEISLDWTLGETFVESTVSGNRWHTQGFHQPLLSAKALFPSNAMGYDVKIFPNPASELLNIFIKTTEEEILNLKLVDVTGKTIYNQVVPPRTAEVQLILKHVPEGMYMLSIVNPSGYRINSFKIIKL